MNSVSQYIQNQFPDVYRDVGENLVSFIEAYYEYMDEYHGKHRNSLTVLDIDRTLSEYVKFFKETYLKDFPFISATNQRFMIKNIEDFYSSKGTELSTELLMKMLFGGDTKLYYPGHDVLKPSDSEWFKPVYIEVSSNKENYLMIDSEIVGTRSNARAIVEGVVTKKIAGKYIDVVYLSSVRGDFKTGENISSSAITQKPSIITGSLTSVDVINGGRNNKVGDIYNVMFENGRQGKVRVSETEDATGRVDFELIEGGSGYTVTNRTKVYISSAVALLKNPDREFIDFEQVHQNIEKLSVIAIPTVQDMLRQGTVIQGVNSVGTLMGTGRIISSVNRLDTDTAINYSDIVAYITAGSFTDQLKITTAAPSGWIAGETIEQNGEYDLMMDSVAGTPPGIGQRLEQKTVSEFGAFTANMIVTGISGGTIDVNDIVFQRLSGEIAVTGTVTSVSGGNIELKNITPQIIGSNSFVVGPLEVMSKPTIANVASYTALAREIFSSHANGVITTVSGSIYTATPVWGRFAVGPGKLYANSTSNTVIGTVSITSSNRTNNPSRATITLASNTTTFVVNDIVGDLSATDELIGSKSKSIAAVLTSANEGATDIWVSGVATSNAIIDVASSANPSGVVIGQNNTSVGIFGNTTPFYSSDDINITESARVVTGLFYNPGDLITFVFDEPHSFTASESIKIDVDLLHEDNIVRIYGVYSVDDVQSSTRITVSIEQNFVDIIQSGNFSVFGGSVQKTLVIPIVTDRNQLISPPLDNIGSIIEVSKSVISLSTGIGANFGIGAIENSETIFLETDMVGDLNVANTSFLSISLDSTGSGIGMVEGLTISSGGTGYANGAIISFSGGGFSNGDPEVEAIGVINTLTGGAISSVTMLDHGQGYYAAPAISYPGGNNSASATVNMTGGYGFPLNPGGHIDTPMNMLFDMDEFTIGTIASLTNVNPGSNYNVDPFIRVINPYISGFNRLDLVVELDVSGVGFSLGESLYQTVPGESGGIATMKGFVIGYDSNAIYVRRTTFNTSFTQGFPIVGAQSQVSAEIIGVTEMGGTRPMGDNAVITGTVIAADGIATKLEVIESGYGYEENEEVMMTSEKSIFNITGTSHLGRQGVGSGLWKTQTSHLNGSSNIHDNFYYQEYSYEVITSESIEQYETVLKNLIHVAGNEFFGRVEKTSESNAAVKAIESKIEVEEL